MNLVLFTVSLRIDEVMVLFEKAHNVLLDGNGISEVSFMWNFIWWVKNIRQKSVFKFNGLMGYLLCQSWGSVIKIGYGEDGCYERINSNLI